MGACATKPKALKEGDDVPPAPVPAPEPTPGSEAKEVDAGVKTTEEEAKIEGGDGEKVKVEGGDEVDGQGNKPSSLSLLLKENEEGKESSNNAETTQIEPVKQEEDPKTEISTDGSNTIVPEAEPTAETGKPEHDQAEEEKGVTTKDDDVTEKASNNDKRQEQSVLPVSSAPVVA